MAREIQIAEELGLEDYEAYPHLAAATLGLRAEAAKMVPRIGDRTIWMVNSTAQGGGVAEMLPKMIFLLRELGLDARWLVIESDEPAFFTLTKRLHNLIHGVGEPLQDSEWREVYESVSRQNADAIGHLVNDGDILVIHDPQPLGAGAMLLNERPLLGIWRCHIGLDERNDATRSAWNFLQPWLDGYLEAVFSAPEYIPSYLVQHSTVIHPGIDPLSHKNRDLPPHKLQGILCNSALAVEHEPVLTPPFDHPARRLSPTGEWVPATSQGEIGLLFRPIVTQISRWDRLKGFLPLLDAFVALKDRRSTPSPDPLHRRRLELARLVLAGPDPSSISDDPEGLEVLTELSESFLALDSEIQKDVVLLTLPMDSRKENALMCNALQRCSSVVVQNSVQEGFGLTVTEAMWKRRPVVGTYACGIRQQIREGIDGHLVPDPHDSFRLAQVLDELLADPFAREYLASQAQKRVHDEFLVFSQIKRWLRLLVDVVARPTP